MATATGAPQIAPLVKTRWLWVARVATLVGLLEFIPGLVDQVLKPQGFLVSPITFAGILQGLYFDTPPVVFAITLVGILVGLFSKAPKRALPWGFGTGSLIVVLAAIDLAGAAPGDWREFILLGLFLVTQAVLAASALKAFYVLGPEKGDRRKLAEGIFGTLILLFIVIIITPPPPIYPSIRARGSLQLIYVAEIAYAETYKAGFSPTLAAAVFDTELAGGRKWGYAFTYTPGPRDNTGHIATYTVVARPLKYGKNGRTSFFMDESGVIHKTDENRPATPRDRTFPDYRSPTKGP